MEDVERTAKEHLARRDYEGAATVALEAYGPEILGFLVAIHRDRLDAGDVFSAFCEDFWTALPRFRGEASLRTWAYTLARHASAHFFREPHRRRASALSNHPELQELEERIRTRTPSFLGKSTRDLVSELRQQLTADEQSMVTQIRDWIKQSKDATKDGDDVRDYNLALKAHKFSDELVKAQ